MVDPAQQPDQDTDHDQDNDGWGPLGTILASIVAFVLAGLVMSPLWEQIENKDSGRRAGFAQLLEGIGQTNVALIVAAIGVVLLAVGVVGFIRARRRG
jgi:hypothetical protein